MTSNDIKVTSKDDDKCNSIKLKSEINLKGGDLDDVSHSNGGDLIEQVFSSR